MENNNCSVYAAEQNEIINRAYRFLLSTTGQATKYICQSKEPTHCQKEEKDSLNRRIKKISSIRVQLSDACTTIHMLSPLKEIQECTGSSTSYIMPKTHYCGDDYSLRIIAKVIVPLILLLVFRKLNKSSRLFNIIKHLSNILFFKFHVF